MVGELCDFFVIKFLLSLSVRDMKIKNSEGFHGFSFSFKFNKADFNYEILITLLIHYISAQKTRRHTYGGTEEIHVIRQC